MDTLTRSRMADALADLRRGQPVIVLDGADRENEGDLVMAAERITPGAVNFMAQHGRGLVCAALTPERFAALELDLMAARNTSFHCTAFGVGVDLNIPGHTGISTFDRAATLQALVDSGTRPQDLLRPGHVFPLRAAPGGLLERQGHTEVAVELARMAGLEPVGVLCEILDESGAMARRPALEVFARRFDLAIITIEEVVERLRDDRSDPPGIDRVAQVSMPTERGILSTFGYERHAGGTALAIVCGDVRGHEDVLVRIHSECLTGDVFGSTRCDCGEQLRVALDRICDEGQGVLLYLLGHEGRGIGLMKKLRAYALQDAGWDTVEANHALGFPGDLRDYGMAAEILRDLGVSSIRLLTNNPAKAAGLAEHGIQIASREPIETSPRPENVRYLRTKRDKLGHLLTRLESRVGGSS
jgi:3,4-dihydroxy 2-butanone 4-phosphate synthase / GTP cyclohydrolase II